MKMTVTQDYYKLYDLSYNETAKNLHRKTMDLYNQWMRRQSATDPSETTLLETIQKHIKILRNAVRVFRNEDSKEKYDKALQQAYEAGTIKDEEINKAKTALETANDYFNHGKFVLAIEYARQAIQYNQKEKKAHEILINSYYMLEKYEQAAIACDEAISLFPDDVYFKLRTVRIDVILKKDIEKAQKKINDVLTLFPNDEFVNAEQIFLYLYSDELDLAYQEIEKYIATHERCSVFRERVANDLATYSLEYYTEDPRNNNVKFIMSEEAYNCCLELCEKAYEIYQNEYTKSMLEDTRYYGQTEFNEDNKERLKWLLIGGIVYLPALPMGIILLIIYMRFRKISYRPYWQINRIYMTGWVGRSEAIIILIACLTTAWLKFLIVLGVTLITGIFAAASGGSFSMVFSAFRIAWRNVRVVDEIRFAINSILYPTGKDDTVIEKIRRIKNQKTSLQNIEKIPKRETEKPSKNRKWKIAFIIATIVMILFIVVSILALKNRFKDTDKEVSIVTQTTEENIVTYELTEEKITEEVEEKTITESSDKIETEKETQQDRIYISEQEIGKKIIHKNHQYQVFNTSLPWYDAEKYCEQQGGYLVTITSMEEQKVIENLIKEGAKKFYWIGATDEEKEGEWKWISGEVWEYTNWNSSPQQPDNHSGYGNMEEDYAEILGENGLWMDLQGEGDPEGDSALEYAGFICEWEIEETKTSQDSENVANGVVRNKNSMSKEQWGEYLYNVLIPKYNTITETQIEYDFINSSNKYAFKRYQGLISAAIEDLDQDEDLEMLTVETYFLEEDQNIHVRILIYDTIENNISNINVYDSVVDTTAILEDIKIFYRYNNEEIYIYCITSTETTLKDSPYMSYNIFSYDENQSVQRLMNASGYWIGSNSDTKELESKLKKLGIDVFYEVGKEDVFVTEMTIQTNYEGYIPINGSSTFDDKLVESEIKKIKIQP